MEKSLRCLVPIAAILFIAIPVPAQIKAGTVNGKVTDIERDPLPGVSITLNGPEMAPLTIVTNEAGMYRFPSIPPGTQYVIKAELAGFKSVVHPAVVVNIGANTEIDVTLEPGKIEEQITVTAPSPFVDPKKTTTAMSVNKDELQSLPTNRNPWAIIQMAPSVMIDRENVGGNESGQQSAFYARGDMAYGGHAGFNNLWMLDGIDITDPAALGGSPFYYDFDAFEELNIQTGGAADVTIQTGGVILNMVTRRGGNRTSLAGRFYLADNYFQSDNLTPELQARGVVNTNKIQHIKDFGFNAGGPLAKDKVWWWGSYGIQDIFVYTILGAPERALLNNYGFKLNAQLLANNRLEAFIQSGEKEKLGANSSPATPEGNHQVGKHHWGNPVFLFQDEQIFGNDLYLSLKASLVDSGFGFKPMVDEGLIYPSVYDNTQRKYVPYGYGVPSASWHASTVARPRSNFQLNANYFNDAFLGLSHELKLGVEYSHKQQVSWGGESGNFNIYTNYASRLLDANHDGVRTAAEMAGWQNVTWYRDIKQNSIVDQYAVYIQDTITKRRFTVTLGLRYDKQVPGAGAETFNSNFKGTPAWDAVFAPATSDTMLSILPPVSTHALKGVDQILGPNNSPTGGPSRPYRWNTWSPRIGITWDISGNGKTVAKLALSEYGDVLGVGWFASYPIGTEGYGRFWWMDGGWGLVNGTCQRLGAPDGQATLDELFWYNRSGSPNPFIPYRVFDDDGNMDAAIAADLEANGYNSQPYLANMLGGYDWNNKTALDYEGGVPYWIDETSTQSSTRTREVLLSLEREILPNFTAAVTGSFRRYDNFDYDMAYYPADKGYDGIIDPGGLDLTNLIIDPRHPPAQGPWYAAAGSVPAEITINYPLQTNAQDGAPACPWASQQSLSAHNVNLGTEADPNWVQQVVYSTAGASGGPFYLPASYFPVTGTPYQVIKKSDKYTTYVGLDIILTKRLSKRWFMNASFTWQGQRSHWGTDYLDPTNRWAYDSQGYGLRGSGSNGKVAVLMNASWMAKLSGLYQLPYGFDISGTVDGREGWKAPHSFYMEIDSYSAPNPAYYDTSITTQSDVTDSLPTFVNLSLRVEKKVNIGAGRLYFMADVFNLFNAATVNRVHDADMGATYWSDNGRTQVGDYYNPDYRRYNEVLNPRIWRFGVRFEF